MGIRNTSNIRFLQTRKNFQRELSDFDASTMDSEQLDGFLKRTLNLGVNWGTTFDVEEHRSLARLLVADAITFGPLRTLKMIHLQSSNPADEVGCHTAGKCVNDGVNQQIVLYLDAIENAVVNYNPNDNHINTLFRSRTLSEGIRNTLTHEIGHVRTLNMDMEKLMFLRRLDPPTQMGGISVHESSAEFYVFLRHYPELLLDWVKQDLIDAFNS